MVEGSVWLVETTAAVGWQSWQRVWWTRELREARPAAERRRGSTRGGCVPAAFALATGGGGGAEGDAPPR